jgi:predicted dienelactone hydrolase
MSSRAPVAEAFGMNRVLRAILVVAVAVSAVLLPVSANASGDVSLALPRPTGPFPVGLTTLHLRDESRADPWVPEERRELMVSVWYPALPFGGSPAPYVTEQVSAQMVAAVQLPVAPDILSTVRTHARSGALALPVAVPLVVLSPGFSLPRSTLTALAEDLASRGYVVAGIDHTYESIAVEFPDGRVAPCLACAGEEDEEKGEKVARGRAADVSFVIDRLQRSGMVRPGQPIGMAGHSAGGASAVAAMQADPRIRAGVNMDGSFLVKPSGLRRPFLMLGRDGRHEPGGDVTWDEAWDGLGGGRRWLTFTGAGHNSFTDLPMLGDQIGIGIGFPDSGTMAGARGVWLTREYVAAFADRHLRGRSRPILDRPPHAEVERWS